MGSEGLPGLVFGKLHFAGRHLGITSFYNGLLRGMTTMPQQYPLPSLERLNHFRLVDILPREYDAPLRCTVSEVPLSDPPVYEALSYAWCGDHAVSNPVMELNRQPFPVTHELESALRRLRRADARRTMWIDWICINQADIDERGA